jgi:hypothetical protein
MESHIFEEPIVVPKPPPPKPVIKLPPVPKEPLPEPIEWVPREPLKLGIEEDKMKQAEDDMFINAMLNSQLKRLGNGKMIDDIPDDPPLRDDPPVSVSDVDFRGRGMRSAVADYLNNQRRDISKKVQQLNDPYGLPRNNSNYSNYPNDTRLPIRPYDAVNYDDRNLPIGIKPYPAVNNNRDYRAPYWNNQPNYGLNNDGTIDPSREYYNNGLNGSNYPNNSYLSTDTAPLANRQNNQPKGYPYSSPAPNRAKGNDYYANPADDLTNYGSSDPNQAGDYGPQANKGYPEPDDPEP